MVHALSSATQKVVHRRNENQGGTPDPAKAPRPAPTDATQDDVVVKARPDVAGLRDYVRQAYPSQQERGSTLD